MSRSSTNERGISAMRDTGVNAAQAKWADRFAMELGRLGARTPPEDLVDMGLELWKIEGGLEPEEVAFAEWAQWPPGDG